MHRDGTHHQANHLLDGVPLDHARCVVTSNRTASATTARAASSSPWVDRTRRTWSTVSARICRWNARGSPCRVGLACLESATSSVPLDRTCGKERPGRTRALTQVESARSHGQYQGTPFEASAGGAPWSALWSLRPCSGTTILLTCWVASLTTSRLLLLAPDRDGHPVDQRNCGPLAAHVIDGLPSGNDERDWLNTPWTSYPLGKPLAPAQVSVMTRRGARLNAVGKMCPSPVVMQT